MNRLKNSSCGEVVSCVKMLTGSGYDSFRPSTWLPNMSVTAATVMVRKVDALLTASCGKRLILSKSALPISNSTSVLGSDVASLSVVSVY